MAFHFKHDESIPGATRRIAQEELESASKVLSRLRPGSRDQDIHEARKSIKKVRALLRLFQSELGDVYDQENKRLRNLGRKLSTLRDGGAVIEIFDDLKKKYPDEWKGSALDPVRRKLVARKKHAEAHTDIDESLRKVAAPLSEMGQRVKDWPLQTDGFPAIEEGLERTFRRGRKAFTRAQKSPRTENYHEWRKRVKDHWYHIRLLERGWTEATEDYEKTLKELETWLGDDHNLALLRETIAAKPAALVRLINKYQKDLRDKAESTGQDLYQEKPRQFTERMKKLWD